jgi:hypothetical protein
LLNYLAYFVYLSGPATGPFHVVEENQHG